LFVQIGSHRQVFVRGYSANSMLTRQSDRTGNAASASDSSQEFSLFGGFSPVCFFILHFSNCAKYLDFSPYFLRHAFLFIQSEFRSWRESHRHLFFTHSVEEDSMRLYTACGGNPLTLKSFSNLLSKQACEYTCMQFPQSRIIILYR
jgi:hypothetical protein